MDEDRREVNLKDPYAGNLHDTDNYEGEFISRICLIFILSSAYIL